MLVLQGRRFLHDVSQLSDGSIIAKNIPSSDQFTIIIINTPNSYDYLHISRANLS